MSHYSSEEDSCISYLLVFNHHEVEDVVSGWLNRAVLRHRGGINSMLVQTIAKERLPLYLGIRSYILSFEGRFGHIDGGELLFSAHELIH
jgi:hypothetical protein